MQIQQQQLLLLVDTGASDLIFFGSGVRDCLLAIRIVGSRTWSNMGGEVRVSFVDQGEGIAREHLPRLTERFYRVDVGESRAQGGTGLGLALVKHILNRHHGRLSIESREGEGATFTVRLSLSDGKSPLK